jgi:hypothetical protein
MGYFERSDFVDRVAQKAGFGYLRYKLASFYVILQLAHLP